MKALNEMNLTELGIALNLETIVVNEMAGGLMSDEHDYSSCFQKIERIQKITNRLSEILVSKAVNNAKK